MINRLADGLAWLRDNNGESLIKNQVSVELGKDSAEQAEKIMSVITKHGLEPKQSESVHPATLSAHVREHIEKGTDVPFETLSIYNGRKATIKAK